MAEITLEATENHFLLLVSTTADSPKAADLAQLIKRIDAAYMSKWAPGVRTVFHGALIGPYDFAILYSGPVASAIQLAQLIDELGEGSFETLTMPTIDLDEFLGMQSETSAS